MHHFRVTLGKEALVCLDNLGSFHFRDKQTEASCGEGATLSFHALRCLTRLVADRPVLLLAAKPVLFKPRGGDVEWNAFLAFSFSHTLLWNQCAL